MTSHSITHATSLGSVLREGSLRAVYQPVVQLDSREVVADEALARGPGIAARALRGAHGRRLRPSPSS